MFFCLDWVILLWVLQWNVVKYCSLQLYKPTFLQCFYYLFTIYLKSKSLNTHIWDWYWIWTVYIGQPDLIRTLHLSVPYSINPIDLYSAEKKHFWKILPWTYAEYFVCVIWLLVYDTRITIETNITLYFFLIVRFQVNNETDDIQINQFFYN